MCAILSKNEKYPLPVEPTEAIELERKELNDRVVEAMAAASTTELGVVYPATVVRMKITSFNRVSNDGGYTCADYIRPIRDAYREKKGRSRSQARESAEGYSCFS